MCELRIDIKPHFKIMLTDETEMWCDEVRELARGKLLGAYLIDTSRHVHICSTQPSYEGWWLYTVVHGEELPESDNEKLWEMVNEGDSNQGLVTYFNARSVTNFAHDFGERGDCGWHNVKEDPKYYIKKKSIWLSDDYDGYQELVDDMLEECHANHYV